MFFRNAPFENNENFSLNFPVGVMGNINRAFNVVKIAMNNHVYEEKILNFLPNSSSFRKECFQ